MKDGDDASFGFDNWSFLFSDKTAPGVVGTNCPAAVWKSTSERLPAHVVAVHPDTVMMAPGMVTRNPHVTNRSHIIFRSMNVIWAV
jgi:hypothetical protein